MNKSEKFWDRLSNNFDKRVKKHFGENYIKTMENTKKYLNVSDIVLDYACGTGIIAAELAGNVKKIHAIDISSKMIEAAKRKAVERKIENIDFAQATIFDERFKRESFDVILAFNILHLLEDTQNVMQRINELLKPGGLMISSTVCMGEKKTFVNILIFILIKIGMVPYIRFFKFSELEDSITNGNFQIVETKSWNHSPTDFFVAAKKI